MNPQQESVLINGGDCPLHYHTIDRVVTHDTLNAIYAIATQHIITTATFTASGADDIIICPITCTITLPTAKNGKRYIIIKTFSGSSVIINSTGTDTINGSTSNTISTQWDTRTLLAIDTGGWIII